MSKTIQKLIKAKNIYDATIMDTILYRIPTSPLKEFSTDSSFSSLTSKIKKINVLLNQINQESHRINQEVSDSYKEAVHDFLVEYGVNVYLDSSAKPKYHVKIGVNYELASDVFVETFYEDQKSGMVKMKIGYYTESYHFVIKDGKIKFEKYDCLY